MVSVLYSKDDKIKLLFPVQSWKNYNSDITYVIKIACDMENP